MRHTSIMQLERVVIQNLLCSWACNDIGGSSELSGEKI